MTSEIAAGNAASGTLHLVNQSRKAPQDRREEVAASAERTGCRIWSTATPPGNSVTPPT